MQVKSELQFIIAEFESRDGLTARHFFHDRYPPTVMYRLLNKELKVKMEDQKMLSEMSEVHVRVYLLVKTERNYSGTISAWYKEADEQRTKRHTEEDYRWCIAALLTRIEKRFEPHGALEMSEAIDIAKEILGEPRPDGCLEELFKLWQKGYKV